MAVRADSTWDVPEPELAVVVNAHGEIVGYTIGDDVSSRSIEGENPLYLPQAKLYHGACAVGPGITPAWEVPDPYDLAIWMAIERDNEVIWEGETRTSGLKRRLEELVSYLFREDDFPDGAIIVDRDGAGPRQPVHPRRRRRGRDRHRPAGLVPDGCGAREEGGRPFGLTFRAARRRERGRMATPALQPGSVSAVVSRLVVPALTLAVASTSSARGHSPSSCRSSRPTSAPASRCWARFRGRRCSWPASWRWWPGRSPTATATGGCW